MFFENIFKRIDLLMMLLRNHETICIVPVVCLRVQDCSWRDLSWLQKLTKFVISRHLKWQRIFSWLEVRLLHVYIVDYIYVLNLWLLTEDWGILWPIPPSLSGAMSFLLVIYIRNNTLHAIRFIFLLFKSFLDWQSLLQRPFLLLLMDFGFLLEFEFSLELINVSVHVSNVIKFESTIIIFELF